MTRRSRVARIILAVGLVAGPLWVWSALGERVEARQVAAERYGDYATNYEYDRPPGGSVRLPSSCYGARWDGYSRSAYRDKALREADKGYTRARADHYRRLSARYEAAARRPWISMPPAPPAPPDLPEAPTGWPWDEAPSPPRG